MYSICHNPYPPSLSLSLSHTRTHTHTHTHDSSSTWKQVSASKRKELLEGDDFGREDGEFWMSYADVKKHFTDFEITNVTIDQLYEDDAGQGSKFKGHSW